MENKNLVDVLYGKNDTLPIVEKRFKYVIYCRKSTDDKDRQAKSIPEQIKECRKFADDNKLDYSVKDIITESQSAKESGIRPKFRQMLADIKEGKFDGIIAWHPDRLARNMLEAGELIDLLDKDIIKDFKFKSFTFNNDPSGKLLLGITFAMSKNYSDKLGVDVLRGIRNKIAEGNSFNVIKKGYYRDINKRQHPDGKNFDLICKAWEMRLNGKSQKDIAMFLNASGFEEAVNEMEHRPCEFDEKKLSRMFSDPFYMGVLTYGEYKVDLTEIYDFVPAVSFEGFMKLNHTIVKAKKTGVKADLLRGKVHCSKCGQPMSAGLTTKKLKSGKTVRYFLYRCNTEGCERQNKSTRANIVVNHSIKVLKHLKIVKKKAVYDHYVSEMKKDNRAKIKDIESQIKGLNNKIRISNKLVKELKQAMLREKEGVLKDAYREDFKSEINKIELWKNDKVILENEKKSLDRAIISYEKLIELLENLAVEIEKTKSLERLNALLTKIFSNYYVDGKKVLSYQLEEPFQGMYIDGFFSLVGMAGVEPTC